MTAKLKYSARIHGEELAELENMNETEARKREMTLTKLYARLNQTIKAQISFNEGNLKTLARKRTPFNANREDMLFDGIRD